jgi:hypothetical protein
MGGSYRQCTGCGKRALSIATRCPACGRELTDPPVRDTGGSPELGRFLSPKVVAGVILAATVVGAALLGQSGRPAERRPLATADSVGAEVEVGSASAAATADDGAGDLLVARTWTHVRKSRRVSGDVEAVLLPGDTVVADSLSRGWYRVALEGEVLGYAHQSTLLPMPGH